MVAVRVVVVALLAACGGRAHVPAPRDEPVAQGAITLYRDRAVVEQRVPLVIPANGLATTRVRIARGIAAEEVVAVEDDNLDVQVIRVPDPAVAELELVVAGKRSGPATLAIGYVTAGATWHAAYTLVTPSSRPGDRVSLSGALVVQNATGVALPAMHVRVVDSELAPDAIRTPTQLATAITGPVPIKAESSIPTARSIGVVDLVDGATRIALVTDAARDLTTALVYDPVGPKLDRKTATPDGDRTLGAHVSNPHVTESYEIRRGPGDRGLPGGPVRVLERRSDGSLALLAAGRMFDAATLEAPTDTISLGTAAGIVGRRERREATFDDDTHRVTEEFELAIENHRPHAVDVLIREHLYRGQEWTLPYFSTPRIDKEGAQQIALRARAPARGKVTVLYVVIYTVPVK